MGYQDRDYYRDSDSSGRTPDWVIKFIRVMNWGIPLGTWFGIRVRLHILFVLFLGFELFRSFLDGPAQVTWTLRMAAILFMSVLLHEFGHCFGCRSVGGRADDILMWPLGGLAFCAPPKRPWPEFVTVACGPLVNVVLAALAYAALLAFAATEMPVTLHPFQPYTSTRYLFTGVTALLADVFVVNYMLLLFNLTLAFYPYDGGRLVQIVLWVKMGYVRSMRVATTIGIFAAGVVIVLGFITQQTMLVAIAIFGLITCFQQAQTLRAGNADDQEDGVYAPTFSTRSNDEHVTQKRGWLATWKAKRSRQKREANAAETVALETEVDRILDKVRAHGLHSLTKAEQKTLQRATDRQRRTG